jgi:hypothetical protein
MVLTFFILITNGLTFYALLKKYGTHLFFLTLLEFHKFFFIIRYIAMLK